MSMDKLLVVHPSQKYDREKITQPHIRRLVDAFGPGRTYALYDNRQEMFRYLERSDLTHSLESKLGEIQDGCFLKDLLSGDSVTICGHTADDCHHTAFESVVGNHNLPGEPRQTVTIPTYAISSRYGFDSGATVKEEIDDLMPRLPDNVRYPYELYFTPRLNGNLGRDEITTLRVMAQYIKTCLHIPAEIQVDGKPIYGNTGGNGTLVLDFQNRETLSPG